MVNIIWHFPDHLEEINILFILSLLTFGYLNEKCIMAEKNPRALKECSFIGISMLVLIFMYEIQSYIFNQNSYH